MATSHVGSSDMSKKARSLVQGVRSTHVVCTVERLPTATGNLAIWLSWPCKGIHGGISMQQALEGFQGLADASPESVSLLDPGRYDEHLKR